MSNKKRFLTLFIDEIIAKTTLIEDKYMNFPPTRWKILHQYQAELELWVEKSAEEHIKQYLTEIHGCIYPNDWDNMCLTHISSKTHTFHSCEHCQELISAILTVSQLSRPDLNGLLCDIKS